MRQLARFAQQPMRERQGLVHSAQVVVRCRCAMRQMFDNFPMPSSELHAATPRKRTAGMGAQLLIGELHRD
jgi:hypothetical protein